MMMMMMIAKTDKREKREKKKTKFFKIYFFVDFLNSCSFFFSCFLGCRYTTLFSEQEKSNSFYYG